MITYTETTDIPASVMQSILENFVDADFLHYGMIDSDTMSYRLPYCEKQPVGSTTTLNPLTFEPMVVDDATHELIIRYTVRMNGDSVRGVYCTGPVVAEK